MRAQIRHPFRTWLETQDVAEPALALFDEGMVCYAAGAYRAALVFSYLGLLRAVAHRLMLSQRPNAIPESLWDQIQRDVREDISWEATTFDNLMRVKPTSPFLIDDDMREQLRYWRSRRNDAAHARSNEIDAPHVESLWLFTRSNLAKLIVAGGRVGLYERFRRHFDPSYTPPGADFAPLVVEVPQAIRAQEYTDFLRDVLRLTDDIQDEPYDEYPYMSDAGAKLVLHILSLNDQRLTQALTDSLDTDQRLLVAAILHAPQLTQLYQGRGSFVRKLWHDLLPFERPRAAPYFDPINRSLGVMAFLLRNGLIPEEQREEALEHTLGKFHEGYPHSHYSDEVLNDLAPFDFWEAVKKYGIGWGVNTRWIALNLGICVEYLYRFPVDRDVAQAFANLVPPETDFEDEYLRGANFYEFEDCFDLRVGFFEKYPHKLDELVRVARENNIDISRFKRLMRPDEHVPGQAPP
jgi:hypothetical protein